MITLKKLEAVFDGKPSVCRAGERGLSSIQYVGNGTHRLTYDDKTVLFVKVKEFISEGKEVTE